MARSATHGKSASPAANHALGAFRAAAASVDSPMRSTLVFLFGVSFFFVVACATAPSSKQPAALSDNAATRALHAFFDAEWERAMRESPMSASSLGDRRYNDRWMDDSLAAVEQRRADDRAALAKLLEIDMGALSAEDQLNHDLFRRQIETSVALQKYRTFLIPLNQRGGIQTQDESWERLRFSTVKDFDDWVKRLETLGVHVDQEIALMKLGLEEGRVGPYITMHRRTCSG